MELTVEYYLGERQGLINMSDGSFILQDECIFCELSFTNGCSLKCFYRKNDPEKNNLPFADAIKIYYPMGGRDKSLFIPKSQIVSFVEQQCRDVVSDSAGKYNLASNENRLPASWK